MSSGATSCTPWMTRPSRCMRATPSASRAACITTPETSAPKPAVHVHQLFLSGSDRCRRVDRYVQVAIEGSGSFGYRSCLLCATTAPCSRSAVDKLTYHYDAARSGWNSREQTLTPQLLAGGSFGLLWQTRPWTISKAYLRGCLRLPSISTQPTCISRTTEGCARPLCMLSSSTGFAYSHQRKPTIQSCRPDRLSGERDSPRNRARAGPWGISVRPL